ncbi:MAG TPA: LLM class flavin-dependent oxidoreductase [Polyangiaceae bacterium]
MRHPKKVPIPISILDLAPITAGSEAGQALRNSRDLAEHAERWGYHRFWLAEHHNMPGVASAATAVAICFVAERTSRLRVGAGGIMLPNHAPLVVAEQFGTLASLFPGRIDLGLGRAPGTDRVTMRALRRQKAGDPDSFPEDVLELLHYFGPPAPGDLVRAVPGSGLAVPVWLLGSSLYGAQLAARLGLPFAFAAHFAPDLLFEALDIYRSNFRPSAAQSRPYAMACTHVFAAETDLSARRLFTSLEQAFIALRSGNPVPLPPPLEGVESAAGDEMTAAALAGLFRHAVVGSPETVRSGLEDFIRETAVDELMVTSMIFDHGARLRSFEIVADVLGIAPRRES